MNITGLVKNKNCIEKGHAWRLHLGGWSCDHCGMSEELLRKEPDRMKQFGFGKKPDKWLWIK